MRVLVIVALLFAAVSGWAQDTMYVWAESGLTLRAGGYSGAEKTGVVPFGEPVRLTGRFTVPEEVTVLASTKLPDYFSMDLSLAYTVNEEFVEVEYAGQTGFLYKGYLTRYPAAFSKIHNRTRLLSWLYSTFTTADTLIEYGGFPRMIHFGRDVCYRMIEVDGGSGEAMILPNGSLNEGYLIANHLFGLERAAEWETDPGGGDFEHPELLTFANETQLIFSGSNGQVTVQVVAGMLIISWDWSC